MRAGSALHKDPDRVRKLAFAAVMASISVIMSRFLALHIPMAGMETLRFGMGGLPLILTGLALGPVHGAAAGAVADLIGMAVFPHGPYFPHFTLTAGLTGLIPGLFAQTVASWRAAPTEGPASRAGGDAPAPEAPHAHGPGNPIGLFLPLLGIVVLTQGFTTCFLVPLFLSGITGQPFMLLWLPRVIALVAEAPFFAFVLSKVLPGVRVRGIPIASPRAQTVA